MPRGVAKDFLQLLEGEAKAGRTRTLILFAVGTLFFVPAWFLFQPLGPVVHAATWLAGIGIGVLLGMRRVGGYEDSLRGQWNDWMRLAPACETVTELGRKVRGASTSGRAYWIAALLTVLWSTELLLLVLAFMDLGNAWFSSPVIIANGIFIGIVAGYQMRVLSWTKTFRNHLDDMVQDGEIGVWGAM